MFVWPLMLALAAGEGRGRRMTELTEAGAGKAVEVAPGEEVRVTLKENGTTGYRWTAGTACSAVLRLESERVVPPVVARPGAGGERVWVYKTVGKGSCELSFALGRSWEKAGSGRVVSFPVTVGRK